MPHIMLWWCSRVLDLIVSDSDCLLQKTRKKNFLILHCSAVFVYVVSLVFRWDNVWQDASNTIGLTVHVFAFIWLFIAKRDVTDRYAGFFLLFYAFQLCPGDLIGITKGEEERMWPLCVIIIDVALLCQIPSYIIKSVIAVILGFLAIVAFESTARVGIFDFPGSFSQADRRTVKCDCEKLPCNVAAGTAVMAYLVQILIVMIDFACTRGFADAAINERRRILASIDTAHMVAKFLAKFDLESANDVLTDSTADVPVALRDAFTLLLDNLKTYKPYLPLSCLPVEDEISTEVVPLRSINSSSASQKTHHSEPQSSLALVGSSCIKEMIAVNRVSALKLQTASLFVANIKNSLSVLETSPEQFSNLIGSLISCTSEIVTKNGGTADIFLGDRVFANFGAVRKCFTHCDSCLTASRSIILHMREILLNYQTDSSTPTINVGMASGKLSCGDLGCEKILRFSTVGRLALWVGVVERAGKMLSIPLIADRKMYNEVKHCAEMKASLQPVLFDGTAHLLYDVSIPTSEVITAEWMYQLANTGSGKWEHYNEFALRMILDREDDNEIEDSNQSRLLEPILFDNR